MDSTLGHVICWIVLVAIVVVGAKAESGHRRARRDPQDDGGIDVEQLAAVESGDEERAQTQTIADMSAEDRYLTVWESLGGLSARMTLLAVASEELAQRCRARALEHALPIRPLAESAYWDGLPADLAEAAPRPGATECWQALDRALAHLAAIWESDDAATHADAHEQISIAARALGDELAADGVLVDLDHCVFCQRAAGDQDVRVVYTPRAAICEDCVHSIYSTLDDL